ncbi:MAG TPA: PLP-dependent aminotransferase family protein [Thermoplasmatales archaeon]|nr:PLP-dependent aminotransferase family protein [Thermoplasmatales archaeon]
MNYEKLFSQRVVHLRSSVIRQLLAVSKQPGIISFAGGLPNPKAFPVEDIREIVNKLMDENGPNTLQYGTTQGLEEFREEIARFVGHMGIETDAEQVLITVGSQQALDIVGKVFIDRGDVAIVGLPTYLGAINAFYAYGANMVGVPLDEHGMKVDVLEETIKKLKAEGKRVKLIYTVPTFQNPAGVELSEERRKRMLELAMEHDILVVEDEPYSLLRFEGEPLKPLKHYDTEGYVVYLGTFSKILAPGFRLAYVIAPDSLSNKMEMAKQSMDLCTPPFTQHIAYHYIRNGYMKKHIPRIIEMYRRKRDIMLDAMDEHFPDGCSWTRPRGGMFLWAELPKHISTVEMFDDAVKEKVAYVHGQAFHVDGGGTNAMRLNFTNASDDNIAEGIRRLAKVIKARL